MDNFLLKGNRSKSCFALSCERHMKKIFSVFRRRILTLVPLKKVGSKPKRRERVYKRAVKVQRDIFQKRRSGSVADQKGY